MKLSRRAIRRLSAILLSGVISVVMVRSADAQPPGTTRIRGDITSVDGQTLHVVSRRGEQITLQLAGDVQVQGLAATSIEAIKPGSFIGSAAVGQKDGTLRALEVHVFPESMRGIGEGHRPFDLGSDSTMTNGTVGNVLVSQGRTLKVSYQGGSETIVVPPDVPIVTYQPGSQVLLVPGAHVIIFATEAAENRLTATRIAVGLNGLVPPM